jgi:hypothetical protein
MDANSTTPAKQSSSVGPVLVVIIAIIAGWFLWSNYATKQSIRRVLAEDAAIPALVMQKAGVLDKYWDSSGLVADLVSRMDRIDISGCPTDFQLAYKRHVSAWSTMARTKGSYEGWSGFLKGFFTGGIVVLPAL